ncbi:MULTISPECIES: glycosyltransferase 87 family protein [Kitasatospora]|uniref:Glycosyltransferase 87 family protein n=1 Tax=Kitasatospora cathayae TaxID=3004092 RepID=A0ABY7Q7F0_9ACTN|nr:glycosyltransferase 87 family protein [Kitasatospora sp. HUAS 3-15]WBP88637.1 glycosyltransferase 87 family protein [Kitasatospora sp. HUAS 3-15]
MTAVQDERSPVRTVPAPSPAPLSDRLRIALGAPVRALREAPRRPMLVASSLALLSLVVYAVVRHFVHTSMVDMIVYRAEGAAVAHGTDLYALRVTEWNLPATYPPFAAMLFVPTTWFPIPFLRVAITLGNLGLLALLAHLSFKLVGWPRRELRPIGVVLVTGLGVWLEPVFTTLRYGQINLALGCLILWDLTRSDGHRSKGVAIGIAAGIKLTPGLFAVYLLITGRVRAAFTAALTFLGTFLLGTLFLPDATWGFWTKYLYDSSRVGKTEIVDNQSLRGAFARLLHTSDPGILATLGVGLVALAGLAVAAWAARSGRWLPRAEAWGVCVAAVTAVLISPISWTHHWVWCVPMLVLLAAEASVEHARPAAVRRLRWRVAFWATLLAFLSFAMWAAKPLGAAVLHMSPLRQLPTSIYPWVGLCFLLAAAVRIRARRRSAGAPLVRLPGQRDGGGPDSARGRQQAPAAR